jgi:hypothetical protein
VYAEQSSPPQLHPLRGTVSCDSGPVASATPFPDSEMSASRLERAQLIMAQIVATDWGAKYAREFEFIEAHVQAAGKVDDVRMRARQILERQRGR